MPSGPGTLSGSLKSPNRPRPVTRAPAACTTFDGKRCQLPQTLSDPPETEGWSAEGVGASGEAPFDGPVAVEPPGGDGGTISATGAHIRPLSVDSATWTFPSVFVR